MPILLPLFHLPPSSHFSLSLFQFILSLSLSFSIHPLSLSLCFDNFILQVFVRMSDWQSPLPLSSGRILLSCNPLFISFTLKVFSFSLLFSHSSLSLISYCCFSLSLSLISYCCFSLKFYETAPSGWVRSLLRDGNLIMIAVGLAGILLVLLFVSSLVGGAVCVFRRKWTTGIGSKSSGSTTTSSNGSNNDPPLFSRQNQYLSSLHPFSSSTLYGSQRQQPHLLPPLFPATPSSLTHHYSRKDVNHSKQLMSSLSSKEEQGGGGKNGEENEIAILTQHHNRSK